MNKNANRLKFKLNFSKDKDTKPVIQKGSIEAQLKSFENKYEVGSILGEGAHALVKECWKQKDKNSQSPRKFAVKIFRNGDPEIINIIKKTFNNTRFLNHPTIVREYELFINENTETSYLVMEFCQFPSIQSQLEKQRKFTLAQIKHITRDLMKALEYIHSKGICHRDIKPDNILLKIDSLDKDDEICIKLIDFGVSRRFLLLETGQVWSKTVNMWTKTGNIHYQAPEIIQGCGYNQVVDIWAVGVVLYQLITHKLPFQRENMRELMEEITNENNKKHFEVAEFKEYNYSCQDFIKKLLQVDPKQRMSVQNSFNHPFLCGQLNVIEEYIHKKTLSQQEILIKLINSHNQELIKSNQDSIFDFQNELLKFKEQNALDNIQIIQKDECCQFNPIDFISSLKGSSSMESSVCAEKMGSIRDFKDQFSKLLNDNMEKSVVQRQSTTNQFDNMEKSIIERQQSNYLFDNLEKSVIERQISNYQNPDEIFEQIEK